MSEPIRSMKYYLADGVYMDFFGYDIRLWTKRWDGQEGHDDIVHYIHLERPAVQAMVNMLRESGWEIK